MDEEPKICFVHFVSFLVDFKYQIYVCIVPKDDSS